MKNKLSSILMVSMLILSTLMTTMPIMSTNASPSSTLDYETAIIKASDRLVALQADITEDNAGNGAPDDDPDDGGWNWLIDETATGYVGTGPSSENLYGITALGILKTCKINPKGTYMTAMVDVYTGINSRPEVDSAPDFTFLVKLSQLTGNSAYAELARERYQTKISSVGDYNGDGEVNATDIAEYIRDVRHSQGYDGLIPWDINLYVQAALALNSYYPGEGYDKDAIAMAEVIYQDMTGNPGYFKHPENQWFYYYVLGLSGALQAFTSTGTHLTGNFSAEEIKNFLIENQSNDGSWNSTSYWDGTNWYWAYPDVQSTAYAIMALISYGDSASISAATKAADWLISKQNPNGGWTISSECPEVDSEAAQAIFDVIQAVGTVDVDHGSDGTVDLKTITIQQAINAAYPNDTIIVHEGTYNEKLVVDKSLTIEGVDKEQVILNGTGLSGKGISVEADYVTIRNLTVCHFVEGDWPWGVELVGASHCIIEDLIIYNCASGGINLYRGCHNNIVRNNLIKYCDGNGISIYGSDKGCWHNLIENNEIIDCAFAETGGGTYRVPAICVFSNASYNIVRGNIIRQEAYAGKGRGIVLWGLTYGGSDMAETGNIIENNFVENFDIGIYIIGVNPYTGTKNLVTDTTVRYNNLTKNNVGFKQIGFEDDYSPITLHYNNIYDNHDYGALVDAVYGTAILDARFNWWGDASGPSGMGPGAGDAISENVTYSPWLGYPYGTIPMTYHVDPTGKIQDAINDANPGDTIKVHEGTYTEQLIINKSLTLIGDPMPKIVAPDTRATFTIPESSATFDPIIFAYGSLTGTETISVTIEGFEVDGGNKAASGYRFVGILYRNVKPGVISNNVLHSLYPPSGKGSGPETVGILIYGDSEVEIYQNEIRDFSRVGIGASGDAGPNIDPVVIIQENTVFGNGLEPETDWWAENGIQVGYGATGYIVGNRVFNCTVNNPNWAASGILIVDTDGVTVDSNYIEGCDVGIGAVDFPSAYGHPWDYHILSNILITGNTLIENSWQIDISNDARNITVTHNDIINATGNGIDVWSYFGDVYPTDVKIHYNNIEGSGGYGIWASEELANQPVDARFNWWGDPTGPYHNTTWTYKGEPYGPNYGLGDRVSDYVLYDPWLECSWPAPPPIIKVEPPFYKAKLLNETFTINITINDLSIGWRLVNLKFRLTYNDTLLEIVDVSPGDFFYDPRWNLNGVSFTCHIEDEYAPHILVEFLLLPNATTGRWEAFPRGNGTLLTITFKVIYQERGYNVLQGGYFKPPLTCNFTLFDVLLMNVDKEPVPYNVEHGNYTIYPTNIADVNYDGRVDIEDIRSIAKAFGENPTRPRWNPEYDLNHDMKIDIEDVYISARNFGWRVDC